MGKEGETLHYGATADRTYWALTRAVAELGYTVLHSDKDSRTISFNTGRSMSSWAGQDLGATVFEASEGSDLVIGGSLATKGMPGGGGSQVFAWGEKGRIIEKVFAKVVEVLNNNPPESTAVTEAPPKAGEESSSSSSVADEIAKLAELNKQGALSDDEFAAAKARVLEG